MVSKLSSYSPEKELLLWRRHIAVTHAKNIFITAATRLRGPKKPRNSENASIKAKEKLILER